MKKLAITLALLSLFGASYAQELSLGERWLMNEKLLDLAGTYGRLVQLDKPSSASYFKELFDTDGALVYCDFISSPDYGKRIPVAKYVETASKFSGMSVELSNFKKKDYVFIDGRWCVRLELLKAIEYEDEMGYTFSSRSSQIGEYYIALDCVWAEEEQAFRIASIAGKSNSRSAIQKGTFHVVKQTPELENVLTYGGRPVQFDEYGLAILPAGSEFGIEGDDFSISSVKSQGAGRYEVVSFNKASKPWRARIHLGGGLPGYEVKTGSQEYFKGKERVDHYILELGADAGYAFVNKERLKVVGWLGLGYSYGHTYMQKTAQRDADGNYTSKIASYTYGEVPYDIYGIRQTIDMSDVFARLSVSPEYYLSERLAVVGEFGVKSYFHLKTSENYKLAYAKNGAMVNDGWSVRFQDFEHERTTAIKPFTLAAYVSAGLDYSIAKGMAAYMHVIYDTTLGGPVYLPGDHEQWLDEAAGVFPLKEVDGVDKAYHSMLDCTDSIYRGGISLELGLKFKF